MLEKKFSFGGEDHSLGASYKKSMAQFFFKIFDCLADSRLGNTNDISYDTIFSAEKKV